VKPIFLLGGCRDGGPAARLLAAEPGRPATVRGTLYALPAGRPALALQGDDLVHGELVDVHDAAVLRVLDHLEGVDGGQVRRVEIEALVGLRRVPAWAWIQDDPRMRGGRRLPGGRWTRRRRR